MISPDTTLPLFIRRETSKSFKPLWVKSKRESQKAIPHLPPRKLKKKASLRSPLRAKQVLLNRTSKLLQEPTPRLPILKRRRKRRSDERGVELL